MRRTAKDSPMEVVSPQWKTDKERHDGWLSVFTYSLITDRLITARRGSAWRLFLPIPSSCFSHEHSRASNSKRKGPNRAHQRRSLRDPDVKATVGLTASV